MKLFRGISSFILSLLLVFIIVFIQGSLFVNTRLIKPDFYIAKFEKQGFYDYLYDSVYKNFGQVSRKSNLPQELFNDIVTKDWIKEQTDNAAKETLDYMLYKTDKLSTLDVRPQSEKFNNNLDNYLKGLKLKTDESTSKEIQNIKVQVNDIIKGQANFIDIRSVSNNSSFQKLRKALYLIYSYKQVIFVIALINVLVLLLAVGKGISNFAAWIGYSLIAGGFFTFIPSVIGVKSGFLNNIAISEGTLKQLVVALIKDSLSYFSIFGSIILTSGIILTLSAALYQGRRSGRLKQ
jgi:hypothetical protein